MGMVEGGRKAAFGACSAAGLSCGARDTFLFSSNNLSVSGLLSSKPATSWSYIRP